MSTPSTHNNDGTVTDPDLDMVGYGQVDFKISSGVLGSSTLSVIRSLRIGPTRSHKGPLEKLYTCRSRWDLEETVLEDRL